MLGGLHFSPCFSERLALLERGDAGQLLLPLKQHARGPGKGLRAARPGRPDFHYTDPQKDFFTVTAHSRGLPGCPFATPVAAEISAVVRK